MIKAIIFDVDGVLFDSTDGNGKFLWSKTVREDLGLTSIHFQNIFSKNWESVTTGKLKTIDYLNDIFTTPIFENLNLNADNFLEYWLEKDNFLNKKMIELVKNIKIPKYIATNQEFHRSKNIETLIGQHFDKVFISYKIGHLKPENEFYSTIENDLKISADEIIFVDDTLVNVEVANKRGWITYHYQNDFEDFKKFIENYIDI